MSTVKELRSQLDQTTDAQEYDRLVEEIASLQKATSLEKARKEQEETARKEQEEIAARAKYGKLREKIVQQQSMLAALDHGLLAALEVLFEQWEGISVAFQQHVDTVEQVNSLAVQRGYEKIAKPAPTLCFGVSLTFSEMLTRFTDHRATLRKMRAEGKPAPTKVTPAMMRAHIIGITKDGNLTDGKGRPLE